MISLKKLSVSNGTQLPQDQISKKQLLKQIQQHLSILEEQKNNKTQQQSNLIASQIKTLQLRKKLIASSNQLSQTRLDHLQQIFKHYCTHIFKTGKYMTFQRLQYEKIHLTMDRFFVFLKDFDLTSITINEKSKELVDKNLIVIIFKKISNNSRDLTFQEFIACLEKIAIIYYNQKSGYQENQKNKQKLKQKKKLLQLKKLKNKDKHIKEQHKQQINHQQIDLNIHNHHQQQQQHQNDDLIQQLMDNQNIENVDEMIERQQKQLIKQQQKQNKQDNQIKHNKINQLLKLTDNQKIQYFYRVINVDSANDFRKKMSKLNLPIFQSQKNQENKPVKEINQIKAQSSPSVLGSHRVQELKQKLTQRRIKQKEKNLLQRLPKHLKDDDQKNNSLSKDKTRPRKNQLEQNQFTLNGLYHMSLEQLKLPIKFNPMKLFSTDDDDSKFLSQYSIPMTKIKIASEANKTKQKQSKSIVEGLKKRTAEVQKKQKADQKKFNDLTKKVYNSQKIVSQF